MDFINYSCNASPSQLRSKIAKKTKRNPRRQDEATPSPDSWGNVPPPPQSNNEAWNPNKVPWE